MALTRPRYSQIYDTDYKQSVRLATTADVGNLLASSSITSSVDGQTVVANDRILVKDQSDPKQNGIYRVVTVGSGSNGTWIRALDADAAGNNKVTSGMTTTVTDGSANIYKTFKLATPDPIVVGVTELTFVNPFSSAVTPAGSTGYVQLNDTGILGASAGLTFNKTSNVLAVSGNITVGGNLIANASGQFSGPFDESTTTSGVFVGNTGSGTPSPRLGFFNGNTAQNWQIDNYFGAFRWFVPGAVKMSLEPTGNVTYYGSLLPSANVTYDLGSPTQRWRTGYFSASTLDLGGHTISVDAVDGFKFSVGGAAAVISATKPYVDSIAYSNVNLQSYLGTGTITISSINSPSIGNASAKLTGVIQTASQTNITAVGTLTGLTVSGSTAVDLNSSSTNFNLGLKVGRYITGQSGSKLSITNQSNGLYLEAGSNAVLDMIGTTVNLGQSTGTGTFTVTMAVTDIQGTQSSTSTTTGALRVAGGVGIGGNLYAGNVQGTNLTGTIQTAAQPNITSIGTLTGLTSSGAISITDATQSTAYNNGALIVNGGVGIAKDVFIQGNLYVANVINTSTTTLEVAAPLVYLRNETTYPYNYDIGIYSAFTGGPANIYAHTGLIRNDSDGAWYLFSNVGEPATGQINFTNAIYDSLVLGNITIKNGAVALINGQSSGTGDIGASAARFGTVYSTGVNVSGTATIGAINSPQIGNASAVLTGTLSTASQTNITAIGTLSALAVSGTATIGTVNSPQIGNTSAVLTGTLSTASQTNITGVGTLSSLAVSGTATIGAINSPSIGNASAVLTGTLSTASQTNITAVGTISTGTWSASFGAVSGANLTSLTAGNLTGTIPSAVLANSSLNIGTTSVALNRASAALTLTGVSLSTLTIGTGLSGTSYNGSSAVTIATSQDIATGASPTFAGLTVPSIIHSGTTGVGNIGASGASFNTVFAKATSAQYADLAEIYTSDKNYVPGTVVVFGGNKEVTLSTQSHDPSIAGVVSTNPAYLMNSETDGVAVALQGRVPTRVKGPISKGDRIVSSDLPGVATKMDKTLYEPGCIIGKALEDILDDRVHTIEVVIGRN